MDSLVEKTADGREYKVKDISLADRGPQEIELVGMNLIGLRACVRKLASCRPIEGARITAVLPMTVHSAFLIETLTHLGAKVRCCSDDTFSTQDHAAAAIARDLASVFAWEGESFQEYWWCIERALDWGADGGPDLIINGGGDAMKLIHEGLKAEKIYETTGKFPDPDSTDNAEFKIVLTIIRDGLKTDSKRYHKIKEGLAGVSEGTITGVERLYEMQANGSLWYPAINVNDSVTKNKLESLHGSSASHLFVPGATNLMIPGRVVVVCGYSHVASVLKQTGARVIVSETDPICALQAVMEGLHVQTLDEALPDADIFVTTPGYKRIMVHHMRKMKNNAIVCNSGIFDDVIDMNGPEAYAVGHMWKAKNDAIVSNIGHFYDEIDMNGLAAFPGVKHITINRQTDRWVFPDTNSGIIVSGDGCLMNLGCVTGYPSFAMSCLFTNQVIALLELWNEKATGKYKKKVYALPNHLDEKVAALHLGELGAKLTKLSKEQSEGPYNHAHHRYHVDGLGYKLRDAISTWTGFLLPIF